MEYEKGSYSVSFFEVVGHRNGIDMESTILSPIPNAVKTYLFG